MELKYKKERELLLGKLYEKHGCSLSSEELLKIIKPMNLPQEDFLDMLEILSNRGFISVDNDIDTQVNQSQVVTVVMNIKSISLTPKGINYWEEKLER